jgi:hypothetical protein
MRRGNIFWGLFIILLGVLFFLQARGIIANVFRFIFPLALILVGGWIILNVFWKPDLSDDDTFSFALQSAKSVRITNSRTARDRFRSAAARRRGKPSSARRRLG